MTTENSDFINSNLGLARSCAARYIGKGMEYDELYQTACVGLIKAAKGFDEARGVKFSTYAVPVILGELRQSFRREGSIKVSRGLKELSMRAAAENERFIANNGRSPKLEELSGLLGGVKPEELALAMCSAQRPVSLLSDEDGTERYSEPSAVPFDERLTELVALREAVAKLSDEDRRLLHERYRREKTQSLAGKTLGMSQVQVSRRETKILAALRRELQR